MFAAIYTPNFSLQSVLRHEPELIPRAVALMDPALTKAGLLQITARARNAGICEGMTAAQGLGRCPQLIVKTRSPSQEESATEALIQTALAFSPSVEAAGPGMCILDLKGLSIQTQEASGRRWAETILEVLARFYLEGRIGFAPAPALALVVARAAQPVLVATPDFLSALPVTDLGLPLKALEILRGWGIVTADALLRLGKDRLRERLGPIVFEIFDHLSPVSVRPLKLALPAEIFAEQMEFESEIETLEPLLFVLRRFVEQLSRRIGVFYLVVSELHLKLGLASGACHESVFRVPSPTGEVKILFQMLHTHLETVRTDAAITSLRLEAKAGKQECHQFNLFEATLRNPNQFAEMLAQLEALCGPNRVGIPCLEPTRRPDSFRLKSAEFNTTAHAKHPVAVNRLRPRGLQLRRFRPPLSARVEFRERCPSLIRSEVFNGQVVDQRGPFYSTGDWWSNARWQREEWDVQTASGAIYRIFQTAEACFVEGVYD